MFKYPVVGIVSVLSTIALVNWQLFAGFVLGNARQKINA